MATPMDVDTPTAGDDVVGKKGKGKEAKKRFEVKKWNAVALWQWDIVVDNCAICRNHIMELCIECQANQASATSEDPSPSPPRKPTITAGLMDFQELPTYSNEDKVDVPSPQNNRLSPSGDGANQSANLENAEPSSTPSTSPVKPQRRLSASLSHRLSVDSESPSPVHLGGRSPRSARSPRSPPTPTPNVPASRRRGSSASSANGAAWVESPSRNYQRLGDDDDDINVQTALEAGDRKVVIMTPRSHASSENGVSPPREDIRRDANEDLNYRRQSMKGPAFNASDGPSQLGLSSTLDIERPIMFVNHASPRMNRIGSFGQMDLGGSGKYDGECMNAEQKGKSEISRGAPPSDSSADRGITSSTVESHNSVSEPRPQNGGMVGASIDDETHMLEWGNASAIAPFSNFPPNHSDLGKATSHFSNDPFTLSNGTLLGSSGDFNAKNVDISKSSRPTAERNFGVSDPFAAKEPHMQARTPVTRKTSPVDTSNLAEFDPLIPIPSDWMMKFDSPQAFQAAVAASQTPAGLNRAARGRYSPPPSLIDSLSNEFVTPNSQVRFSQKDVDEIKQNLTAKFEREFELAQLEIQELEQKRSKAAEQQKQFQATLSEWEQAMTQMIAEREIEGQKAASDLERCRLESEKHREERDRLKKENEILMIKYKQLRVDFEDLRESEEKMRGEVNGLREEVALAEQRYGALKDHAEQKLESANVEIAQVRRTFEKEVSQLKAKLSRAEVQNKVLESTIATKTRENDELAKICDDLVAQLDTSTG
ncbi:hypothetical protein HK104_010279 [Borealophlyctis nickersoniae]|nr:hypothetical protein HK104_010279 [Borealophlyctis nickersoniae]